MVGALPQMAGQPEEMQVRGHADEESSIERKSGKLRGDAVRTPGRPGEGLDLLARMIARAYLRDRRQGDSDGNVEGTRISQTGDSALQDSEEVQDETRYNQETQ